MYKKSGRICQYMILILVSIGIISCVENDGPNTTPITLTGAPDDVAIPPLEPTDTDDGLGVGIAPGERNWIFWTITFDAPDQVIDAITGLPTRPVVKKSVSLWRETESVPYSEWDRYFYRETNLNCNGFEDENVSIGPGYVEFGPGGFISCDDVDLQAFIGSAHDLDNFVNIAQCRGGDNAIFQCIRTESILVWAEVRLNEPGNQRASVLSYPQFEGEWMGLDYSYPPTAVESIAWKVQYANPIGGGFTPETYLIEPAPLKHTVENFGVGAETSISEDGGPFESDFGEWRDIHIQALRLGPHIFQYSIDGIRVNESGIGAADTRFVFPTNAVTLYFGNFDFPNNESRQNSVPFQLRHLIFDPGDSCEQCAR